ncbi:MAG TPA: hypothetical protein VHH88_09560 [Verrucomicrobiae bacterium]|nr:hypothetical protein [Verrucomicrobiae bacterium]
MGPYSSFSGARAPESFELLDLNALKKELIRFMGTMAIFAGCPDYVNASECSVFETRSETIQVREGKDFEPNT